jgi:hypothetical protein
VLLGSAQNFTHAQCQLKNIPTAPEGKTGIEAKPKGINGIFTFYLIHI